MNYVRLLIGAGLAFLVTTALFVIMPALIESADKTLDESKKRKIADITMPDREIDVKVKENKPDKPEEPEEPPPDLDQPEIEDVDVNPDAVNMSPNMGNNINIGLGSGLGGADGEYLPIVKVAPMYPRRANSRGTEALL